MSVHICKTIVCNVQDGENILILEAGSRKLDILMKKKSNTCSNNVRNQFLSLHRNC